jgi:hypothetical protein
LWDTAIENLEITCGQPLDHPVPVSHGDIKGHNLDASAKNGLLPS